jgi:hypothetical protein
MSQYELSIEPRSVEEAERLVSLEGRVFPTLVVMWESKMLGQDWQTILVLDYTFPLPPLQPGVSFNEVRIAAYTDDVPTKFLYFGTELSAGAPRIAPEMENIISPAESFQEYRLTEESCNVDYLDLIQTTPRIYGNGPQDYYSPPIKVERFDAGPGVDLIADNFPTVVAELPPIPSDILTDQRKGFWQGSRFIGTRRIAILKDGKVVGLRRRSSEKEVVPPEVVRRDPHIDVQQAWVAIDLGMKSTVCAIGDGDKHEFIRIGAHSEVKLAMDYEVPSAVMFNHLPRTVKAWRDRVILPLTQWGDLYVGNAVAERLAVHGKERAQRMKSTVPELGALPARLERGDKISICGRSDLDATATIQPPAPPIIDEEGIGPDDPFDPLELFAYYLGLHCNERRRGIFLRYAVGMPTGWPKDRRQQVLVQVRRGLLRSLPAGMVEFDDTNTLQVVDAGPNVLSFAVYAFKVFGIQPKGEEPVAFVSIDAGASETSVLCGQYRNGTPDEAAAGQERVVEHVEPAILPELGGEVLLHRLAYKVYAASAVAMKTNDIPFELPLGEEPLEGAENRLVSSLDAQTNVLLFKDAVRSILEKVGPTPVPDQIQLFSSDGNVRDVRIMIDRAALAEWLRGQLSEAAVNIKSAIDQGLDQVCRGDIPWDDLRVVLGGRLGMHPVLQERLDAVLPEGTRIHKFREPDETNVAAPTVKLATSLGILSMRHSPVAPAEVVDDRSSFNYRVGRAKRGKLLTVLDDTIGYDVWREMGACTKPDVTVLYAEKEGGPDMDADDQRIVRVTCSLGYDAVGYRVYMRAVGGTRVEVSVGPPGGRPSEDAAIWAVDLASATAEPVSGQ